MLRLELTTTQKIILVTVLLVAAVCAVLSHYVAFMVPETECRVIILPGHNTTVENGQIVLNITRSLLNETLHVMRIKVVGNCIFSLTPVIKNVNLNFTTFDVYFILNNETEVHLSFVKDGNLLKASNIVKIGANTTADMYIRTDASIGLAYIDIIIKQVEVSK